MKRFALVDCNNFFVSCERVFDPTLIGKPVVVLSSNDACVIARSNEAKKLGIKMGEPAFLCKDIFKKYNVLVYSSNFPLYGDMSSRVMQTLAEYATDIEIYSVDESFLFLPKYDSQINSEKDESIFYTEYGKYIRRKVKQQTGIPVSIGMGATKTLAKIANKIAKKDMNGVFDITNHPNLDNILKTIDVADIWGIGYRYAKKLHSVNIKNAFDLKNCDDKWVQKNLTINGLKTVFELRGISCLGLEDIPDAKKSITVSRSFGKNVTNINELKEALASYVIQAAEKLRKQSMLTCNVSVFVTFVKYHDSYRFYNAQSFQLPIATSYTPDLIKAANSCLEKLFKNGLNYKKVGVILDDFYPVDFVQMNTSHQLPDLIKQSNAMRVMDKINSKMGRNKVLYAAAGTKQTWKTKRSKKSPSYTTDWNELLIIKI